MKIKAFNHKWYGFLITYGILNIYFFLSINTSLNNIYDIFSKLYVSDLWVDGTNLSILSNLFATPIFILIALASIIIILILEICIILLFKFVYFKSMVKDEEKVILYRYSRIALLCFILLNIIAIMLWGNIYRTTFFLLLYLPVPLFTFIFICSKIKRYLVENERK